jgi:uncharacterized phage protein (TIGR02220 family)
MKVKATYRLDKELVDRIASTSAIEGRNHTWYVSTALNQYFDKPAGIVSQKKPVASKAVSVVVDDTADKVIDYLNSQAGTRYKHTATNRKLINARLKEYTKREVFDVITKKCAEWKGSEMERYLRPSTLFNATKFDEYLNQKVIDKPAIGRNTPSLDSTRTRDKTVQQQLADKSWAG